MKLTKVLDLVIYGTAIGILTVLLITQAQLHKDIKELNRHHQILAQGLSAIYQQNNLRNKCVNNLNYNEQTLSNPLNQILEEKYSWKY